MSHDICTKPEPHNTQYKEAMARYRFIRELVEGRDVLDAGCGYGFGADYISNGAREVIGVDRLREAIDWAKHNYRKNNLKFILSDLAKPIFRKEYFDAVCFFEVIHQVEEYRSLLKEMHRVLKSGGMFFISTRRREKEEQEPHPYHVHEFKAAELEKLLKELGFEEIQIYGLGRPEETYKLEGELKRLRKFDFLRLRKFMPRRFISSLVYLVSKIKKITPPQELEYENFKISKDTIETDPGILAICKKA